MFNFGGEMVCDSEVNANDQSAEYEEEDAACVSYYHRGKCGRSYEITEPSKEERETYYKEY